MFGVRILQFVDLVSTNEDKTMCPLIFLKKVQLF